MTFIPNADQAKAVDEYLSFLLSPDEREMCIIGPGGVGKSRLVQYLINEVMDQYKADCKLFGITREFDTYSLTALTNKAAASLEDNVGEAVTTIHSFLSLTVMPNFETGKQDLKRTASWQIISDKIIFIDEAYMMDPPLLEQLRQSTMRCKIIYVGDHAQLDPVDYPRSPIRDLKCRTVELTIPMRNAGQPALQDLCTTFRNNVLNQVAASEAGLDPVPWPRIPIVPGVIDFIPEADEQTLGAFLHQEWMQPTDKNLIVGYSNARVNAYNDHIRSMRNLPDLLQPGEKVIANDLFERGKFRIKNEADVQIVEADQEVTFLNLFGMEVPTQYVTTTHDPNVRIPIIWDRHFHKEALKYLRNRAKAKLENWGRYYEFKSMFADFRPRDACTVHKAQGSSKDLVLVDLTNIGTATSPVLASRLLYVALSRARSRIVLYGDLPARYGGIDYNSYR